MAMVAGGLHQTLQSADGQWIISKLSFSQQGRFYSTIFELL